jgi:hypothetical protein
MHLVEEDHSLHIASSSGIYCRLDLTDKGLSSAVRTVDLNSSEETAGGISSWHFHFVKSQERPGALLLFGVSSQGRFLLY